MNKLLMAFVAGSILLSAPVTASDLRQTIAKDYDVHLGDLWEHFHRNPELSLMEVKTAKRLAEEIRAVGFDVAEGIGGNGIVAILKNGDGPMVMVRADMDALPVVEASGLAMSSTVKMLDWNGNDVGVMHACGHDVHITGLVGTARYMAANKDKWSGTLMLIGQPAEEGYAGAFRMMSDNIWDRFGKPDYALAFHVSAQHQAGKIIIEDAPYAGSDNVDIIIHGVGAHGASPHAGKDPVVIASQIVLNLQTIVSRELAPRDAGVITVGSFHSGTKHNIISNRAHLQLSVRSLNSEVRQQLLDAIERIAIGTARTAGLPEDKMPEFSYRKNNYPPTVNDLTMTNRLRAVVAKEMGADAFVDANKKGMGAEDFGFFTTEPYIPSVYFSVGGTPKADFERAAAGGVPVPSHHSPLFKISPQPSVISGVEATVVSLMELMGR